MKSAAWASFHSAAPPEYFGEPEWDEAPERRDRCTCGAFLSKNPSFDGEETRALPFIEWRLKPGAIDSGDPNNYEEIITGWYEVSLGHTVSTDCKRCGRIWDESEMWE